jgi:hypothetical protein
MCFHFRYGNEEIRAECSVGQVELANPGHLTNRVNTRYVVEIQVDESIFESRDGPEIACRIGKIQRVTAMTGTLGNPHLTGACSTERFKNGVDEKWVRIDAARGFELDEIRLQQNIAPAHTPGVLGNKSPHRVVNALVVCRSFDD